MSTRQVYTGYIEVDTSSLITVAASALTAVSLLGNSSAYVYKDFTAAYFAADFEHSFSFTCSVNTSNPVAYLWGLTNATEGIGTSVAAGTTKLLALQWTGTTRYLTLSEGNGTNVASQAGDVALTVGTKYWVRICRDESTGTYGTLYAYIYSNAAMTEIVDTISLALRIKTDFRYLYALSGQITGAAGATYSGTINNLTLDIHPFSLSTMITRIRSLLAEISVSFWSNAQITSYINEAIRDIAKQTGCIQHIDSATTTTSTHLVAFTGLKCHAVEYIPTSGTRKSLIKISPLEVGHNTFDGVTPQFWFEDGSNVGIDPIPDTTYNLSLYISDYPTADLSVNTEIPCIPPAFRSLITPYAVALAFSQDRKPKPVEYLLSIYNNESLYTAINILSNTPDGSDNLRMR